MRIVNWWTIASLVKKIILLYSNNISLSFSFSTMNTMKIVFALVIYLTVSILQVKSQYVPQSLVIRNILKWRKEHDTYLTHICKHRWSRQIMMKVDTFPELSASTVAFISCRGRVRWRLQCWLKAATIYLFSSWYVYFSDVYWQKLGRCRSLSFLLTYFLSERRLVVLN